MSGCSVDQAVRLVHQAVLQDTKRNYGEAARCYREAITAFRELSRARGAGSRLQDLLATKLGQYETRLRTLEQHLLATSDLTQFFKDLKPGSGRSSLSSESRHLYSNPPLGQALDLLRRGRQEDERGDLRAALAGYESGLAGLLRILRTGHLTERQAESARVKCLLYHDRVEAIRAHLEGSSAVLERGRRVGSQEGEESLGDSDCDSPAPPTESEKMLRMEEVISCSSRFGSTQSLAETPEPGRSASRASSTASLAPQPSTHSLYPTCRIKRSPSVLSVRSGCEGSVPLARLDREMDLSCLSIASRGEAGAPEQIIVLAEDCDESYEELARLKEEDGGSVAGSDSGYSGPSPDGTIREAGSPASQQDGEGRKSPFSDVSEGEDEEEVRVPLVPAIIVQGATLGQLEASPRPGRQLGRQRSRFQTEALQSQQSQDGVAVVAEEQVDCRARVAVASLALDLEVYGRPPVRGGRVPVRAEAVEAAQIHMGCYYLMAALDFCWCL